MGWCRVGAWARLRILRGGGGTRTASAALARAAVRHAGAEAAAVSGFQSRRLAWLRSLQARRRRGRA